ncbi:MULTISPECIES: acetolactate synthase 2 small subunit [unclassified Endozoicomonas]|uniref:acetolactate synthase 2 small subunit n=1 Tax=unclassified Endozoicomonas TaxID=2644528 RepID=UPI002148E3C2|nr:MULTISPECIES: acetolactate synthase 2 small subunit [unclassified Endozoicomonas]
MSDSKTHYSLTIQCYKKPEVLERLLRVVRHRGFDLESLSMNSSECGKMVSAAINVSSERPIETLTRQIEKLYDVLDVCQPAATEAIPRESII